MTQLFGYGTFAHPIWRAAILGASYPAQDATLSGWRRTVTASGYLSIARAPGARIDGVAIALDAIGWTIADAWEEVPRYARVAVDIIRNGAACAAEVYVSTEPTVRDEPVAANRFTLLDDDEVAAAIARFGPQMRALRARSGGATGP